MQAMHDQRGRDREPLVFQMPYILWDTREVSLSIQKGIWTLHASDALLGLEMLGPLPPGSPSSQGAFIETHIERGSAWHHSDIDALQVHTQAQRRWERHRSWPQKFQWDPRSTSSTHTRGIVRDQEQTLKERKCSTLEIQTIRLSAPIRLAT